MKQKQLENKNKQGFFKDSKEKNILLKSILLVLFVVSSSTFTFAQFQWGLKLGANASTQSGIGNICDNNSLKGGLNFGLLGKYQLNDWMELKSGIDFQKKGLKCDMEEENTEVKNNLNYLVLPVKAEFSASEKAGFKNGQRLFFATGPYFGFLLKAEQTFQEQTSDLEDLNDFDFGWNFELGIEFPVFEKNAIQVSLNYDMGITEIATYSDKQNKTASLNLGFIF